MSPVPAPHPNCGFEQKSYFSDSFSLKLKINFQVFSEQIQAHQCHPTSISPPETTRLLTSGLKYQDGNPRGCGWGEVSAFLEGFVGKGPATLSNPEQITSRPGLKFSSATKSGNWATWYPVFPPRVILNKILTLWFIFLKTQKQISKYSLDT